MKEFNEETIGLEENELYDNPNGLIENIQGKDLVESDILKNEGTEVLNDKEVRSDFLSDSDIVSNELKENGLTDASDTLNETLIINEKSLDEIAIEAKSSDIPIEKRDAMISESEQYEEYNIEPPFQHHYFAGLGRRFVAFLIDVSIIQAFYWILLGNWITSDLLEYIMVVAVYCGYFALMTYYFKGQTLGKMIMSLRTVRLDGNYLTLQDVLIREVAIRSIHRVFAFLYLISLFSKEHKQLGDWIADTCVVKDKG